LITSIFFPCQKKNFNKVKQHVQNKKQSRKCVNANRNQKKKKRNSTLQVERDWVVSCDVGGVIWYVMWE